MSAYTSITVSREKALAWLYPRLASLRNDQLASILNDLKFNEALYDAEVCDCPEDADSDNLLT